LSDLFVDRNEAAHRSRAPPVADTAMWLTTSSDRFLHSTFLILTGIFRTSSQFHKKVLRSSHQHTSRTVSRRGLAMAVESSGHSAGNPRLYELVEHAPKEGKSPTIWAWPQMIDYLKVAGQPVQGPWPPHQEPRPDPDADSLPTALPDDGGN
jgi:hypothetical protein